IAQEQRELAEASESVAIQEREEAERQRAEAEAQRREAERQERIAQRERDVAETLRGREAIQRARAESERDNALRTQSLFLADFAEQAITRHDYATALALALEALPDISRGIERPWVHEAELALIAATTQVRELRVFPSFPLSRFAHASADGTRIVTVTHGDAVVWDASTGDISARIEEAGSSIVAVASDNDRTRIAALLSDDFIHVYDMHGVVTARLYTGHSDRLGGSLVFSPDGTRLLELVSGDDPVVWDVDLAHPLYTLSGHEARVDNAVFASDGTHVLTSSRDGTVRIWDSENGAALHVLPGHDGREARVAVSPDGSLVATGAEDGTVRLWRISTGELMYMFSGHEGRITAIDFARDGRSFVTSSHDGTARVWTVDSETAQFVLPNHGSVVSAARFSTGGDRILTYAQDSSMRIWSATSGESDIILEGHTGPIVHADFSMDGNRVISNSVDGTTRVWRVEPTLLTEFAAFQERHGSSVRGVRLSPNETQAVSWSDDNTAVVWDLDSGAVAGRYDAHWDAVTDASFDPSGRFLVTASLDFTASVWDILSGQELLILEHPLPSVPGAGVFEARFSPLNTQIITRAGVPAFGRTAGDHYATIWHSETGAPIFNVSDHQGLVSLVAFSDDGRLFLTASWDGTVRVYDAASGELRTVLRRNSDPITAAAFSASGTYVVTGSSDGTATVWNVHDEEVLSVIDHNSGSIDSVSFVSEEEIMLTAFPDPTVSFYSTSRGRLIQRLSGHTDRVLSAQRVGRNEVLTVSQDGSARVWSLRTGREMYRLSVEGRRIVSAVMTNDGGRIVAGFGDGTVGVWRIRTNQSLVAFAWSLLPRELTAEQRRNFFLTSE
ncbi:MAG: hypothetical protein EA383_14620, partial [Spirochaetaceae bacterium]